MTKYLLVYNENFGDRDTVRSLLELINVDDWRSDIPNVFYFKSKKPVKMLMQIIKVTVSRNCWFLLVDLDTGAHDGFQSLEAWRFLKVSEPSIPKLTS